MVQLSTSAIVLFILVAPSIAAPFEVEQVQGLESRDISNALETRKFHFRIPSKKIVAGLVKWGPKVGKTGFKLAKMFMREDVEGRPLIQRDIDDLEEILARSPKRNIMKLLKAVKKAKKYAKAGARFAEALYGRSIVSRDLDWEDSIVARAIADPEIDTRDLYQQLEVFERALTDLVVKGRDDSTIYGRLYEPEIYERDIEGDLDIYDREPEVGWETYFGRDYDDFGMEELD